jgi:autotransporter-associated beta strand protein
MKPNTPADSATFAARLATLATALSLTGGVARAQLTWNSAGPTDNWSTASGNENWSPGPVVWTQNSNAIFDGGSGAPESINVTTANVFDNLTFDVSGFVITSSGAGSLALSSDLASTVTVTQAGHLATLNETLANHNGIDSSLTKAGLGTLTLAGTAANPFTGGLSVSQGTLVASHEGALGTGPVTVAGGATLDLNKGNVTFSGLARSLSGGGTVRVTALGTGSQTVNLNGDHSAFTGNLIVGVGAAPGAGKIRLDGADNPVTTITIEPNATVFVTAGVRGTPVTLKGGDTGESLGQLRLDLVGTEWAGPVVLDGAMSGAGDGIIGTNSGPVTISGTISELNGPRELTKAGGGTLVLTATNTHSGATRSFAGNLSAPAIGNAGVAGPLGSGSLLGFGNLGSGSTLFYTGAGETTDRVFDLGGNNGNAGINQLGSGPLVFTSNFTATGSGTKALILTATEGSGTGEISGSIPDNAALGTTALAANFLAAATTVTLASVEGVAVGANISGTGIAGGTTITAINTGTRVVTLSSNTTGPGTAGQTLTVDGVVNRTLVTKNDTGTWTLSGANTYSGQTLVNAGVLRVTHSEALGTAAGNTRVVGNVGGLGRVEISGGLTIADNFVLDGRQLASLDVPAISSVSGNNTITGQIQAATGGATYNVESRAGSFLTLAGGFTLNSGTTGAGRILQLQGEGDGIVTGDILNGAGTPTVNKQGGGTWTLAGNNGYTGATTVNGGTLVLADGGLNASTRSVNSGTLVISGDYSAAAGNTTVNGGTLRLDYSTTDSSKLPDGGVLTLAGGTLELAGGTHPDTVASTTVTPGKATLITRSSGGARLDLRAVTSVGTGTAVLAQGGIATTDNPNTNGILPWARVLVGGTPVLGTNSTGGFDGPIVAFTGFTAVNRLGPANLPDGIANNVQIVNGGSAGNLGLAAPLTAINFLQMAASDGPSTVDPAPGEILTIGDEDGGSIWQSAGAGGLTFGTTPDDGFLTTGNTDNASAATLSILNESSAPLVVNSAIANNGGDPVSVVLGGGEIVLAGNNTFTGTLLSTATSGLVSGSNNSLGGVTVNGGTLTLSGDNSFTTVLTANSGGTAILSGNNAGRPGNLATRTVVNAGGIVQLQANAGNTVAAVSTALSTEQSGTVQPFNLFNGGLLQLRSDESLTFAGGNNAGGFNNATLGIDVDRLGGSATARILGFAPGNLPYGNAVTFNITGANGYQLALGTFRNVTGGSSNLTLNPTTADLLLGGYSNQQNNANNSTLTLAGTSPASDVTGAVANQSPTSTGTGIVNLVKNGGGTWSLSGANTYTGTTVVNAGVLRVNHATALATSGTVTVTGSGTLDLNGFNLAVTNPGAGAATATLTDTSAVAGVTTLAITGPAATLATRITDGPARAIRVTLRNANSGVNPFALGNPNTFSGGLLLVNGTGTGTRLRITGAPVTVGTAGAIVSSPFGTGPIILGEAPTDKAGVLLDTAGNYTIANDIVFNTALGTDQPGLRLDTTGHTFSGTITANLSNALFSNVGSARLTGRVTGPNGLQLHTSAITITLANATASPNDYSGNTTLGTGSTLVIGGLNQVPNGAGKGNVEVNGTLNLAGFNQTINGLSGSGTISSSSGAPTLSFGANDSSATFTGNTGGTLGLNKIGSGFITFTGTLAHLGDTTVTQGTLAIVAPSTFADGSNVRLHTGGTLNLAGAGTDVIGQLFINGAPQSPGKWGRPGSIAALGADFETALIGGDGLLSVTSSGGSPFNSWIAGFFPGATDPAIIGQTADPDKDGVDNLTEFAFDGHPASGKENGQIHVFAADSASDGDSDKELILTAAIRSGTAAFASGAPSTAASVADGITYSIQGSVNLAGFTTSVTALPVAITTGLPALNPGYSYRSFSLSGSNGLPGKGFLRAAVTAP